MATGIALNTILTVITDAAQTVTIRQHKKEQTNNHQTQFYKGFINATCFDTMEPSSGWLLKRIKKVYILQYVQRSFVYSLFFS